MKIIYFALILSFLTNVKILNSSEYIQDIFKINDVFLLPSMNTSYPISVTYNYFNEALYVLNNEYNFTENSIDFILYKSETNNSFKKYVLKIPNDGFSKHMHISDIYIYQNKLYLLEFRNLIEFEIYENEIIFIKNIILKNSCSEIIFIDSTDARLTLNSITSDIYKDKEINFIYIINFRNSTHSLINFDNTKYYKLINIGPRKNKVYMNDSIGIYSDIINYNFYIETYSGIKQCTFPKKSWKSNLDTLNRINVNYKQQKESFSNLIDYNFKNSTIYGLHKLGNYILVIYNINSESNKNFNFDLLKYNFNDNSLSILYENIENINVKKIGRFDITNIKMGKYLKTNDKYLLELVKYPFSKDLTFKNEDEFNKKKEESLIEDGLRYSIIVRELK